MSMMIIRRLFFQQRLLASILWLLVLTFFVCNSRITLAKNVSSTYEFSMDIPDNWLFLSAGDESNPETIKDRLTLLQFSEAGIVDIVRRVISGRSEMLFLPNTDGLFDENNHVNIIQSVGVLPDKETMPALCEATEEQISLAFKKKTILEFCEHRQHGVLTSAYLEFDGLVEGTKNAQYHLHDDDYFYVVFSLTSMNSEFKRSNKELSTILNSIRMHISQSSRKRYQ
ncbi:MAG: hypothetical protein ACRBEE_04845 [Arenicella sp.]